LPAGAYRRDKLKFELPGIVTGLECRIRYNPKSRIVTARWAAFFGKNQKSLYISFGVRYNN